VVPVTSVPSKSETTRRHGQSINGFTLTSRYYPVEEQDATGVARHNGHALRVAPSARSATVR